MKTFGQTLRLHRNKLGISLKQLSHHLGISVPYLSDVDRGNRPPLKEDRILRASQYLNLSPSLLLKAALFTRDHFKLSTCISKEGIQAGVALVLNWVDLSDDQFKQIHSIIDGEE